MSQSTDECKICGHLKSHKTIDENVTTVNKKIASALLPMKSTRRGSLAFATFGESKVGLSVAIMRLLSVQSDLAAELGQYLL
jgi:hypothetical protein